MRQMLCVCLCAVILCVVGPLYVCFIVFLHSNAVNHVNLTRKLENAFSEM